MQGFQIILLNLLVLVFLPLSVIAADDAGSVPNDTTPVNTALVSQKNDNIMLRQIQPIIGFQPLIVAGQDIKATFLEETLGESHGAIVFLHDQGEDLESRGVVTPLRHEMLQYGWSTLSLSLDYPFTPNIILAIKPETETTTAIAPAEVKNESPATEINSTTDTGLAKTDDSKKDEQAALLSISNTQRIAAAIEFLNAKDIKRIIFLGHGRGGIVAINELTTLTTPISALILVGTPATENNEQFNTFNQPILDVYGDQDLAGVAAAVNNRKVVMKRTNNIRYTSREIVGANHVFYGLESMLISTVRGWLHATFIKQEKSE